MTAVLAVVLAATMYKTVGDTNLSLQVYSPTSPAPNPAVLLIHGGGWKAGMPELLAAQAHHFASNGFVAVTVEYRLEGRLADCVADCRDALRYVRQMDGVDRDRIVVLGESAGGHIAAMLASEKPAALVLYNPVVDLDALKWTPPHDDSLSPIKQVRAGWPPTLLIHGTRDGVVPVEQADRFAEAMRAAGNRIEYQRVEGWDHAFAIPNYGKPEQTAATWQMTDAFLARELRWRPAAFHPSFDGQQPHVRVASRTFPDYPYLDGQWQGILADSAGDVWFGVSSHDGIHAAQLFRYRPAAGKLDHIADLDAVCGSDDGVPEGKIHSEMFQDGNTIYGATTDAHALHARTYSGGYWLAMDRPSGKVTNLGHSITGDGLLCAGFDPWRKLMYGHTNVKGLLTVFDPVKRTERILGVPQQDVIDAWKADPDPQKPKAIWPRGLALMVTRDGKVYGGKPPGCTFWCYDPATDKITNVPVTMEVPSDAAGSKRWQESSIHLARWNEQDQCFYCIRSYDEMLCRFYPPVDGKPGRLENVAPLGLPGPHRFGNRYPSCTLVIHGRTVWYTPYTGWGGTASLVSYQLDRKELTHHGVLVVDGDRLVAECHSLAAGKDGTLYGVGFVYSIDGQDPVNSHGMRDQFPFHPRLLIVRPML